MARQTTDRGIGEASLEGRARALAERFNGNYEQILQALQKLARELPSLDASNPDLDYVVGIAHEALLALPCEHALELLQATPAGELEERIWVAHYLCGEDDDVPLFSREELAATIESFFGFLAGQRMHLLETGLPAEDFARCRWLDDRLARLYPIRRTKAPNFDNRPAEFPRLRFPPGLLRTKSDVDGPETVNASCVAQNSDLFTGISDAEAERLVSLRPKILDLKLHVLNSATRFLQLPKRGDTFWDDCFSYLRSKLSDDEVIFWTKIDVAYTDDLKMWKSAGPFVSSLTGFVSPKEPGGLTDIIEFIGHVEKERTIGTMHKTRETLGELVFIEEPGARLSDTGPWPYFEIVGLEEQPKLDKAIRVFQECSELEVDFWPDFRNRVEKDLAGKLDPIVTLSFRGKPADILASIAQAHTDWAKSQMPASVSLPALLPTAPQQVVAEPAVSNQYVFRFTGSGWETQFGTGPRNIYPHLDGFLYLSVLLDNAGDGFTPTQLYEVKNTFLVRQGSRSIRPLSEVLDSRGDENPRDSLITAKDLCEYMDSTGRKALQDGLRDVQKDLATARANNDEAEVSRLEKLETTIQEELKAKTGVGDWKRHRSREYKNAQDRVRNPINLAIERIRRLDGLLANHLELTLDYSPLFKYLPEKDKHLAKAPDWII